MSNEKTNRNETLADIVAEMREISKMQTCGYICHEQIAEYADRIEAAAKRVVVSKTETTTVGNAAKLREALERFAEVPDEDLCELEKHAHEMQDHCVYGGGALEGIILRVRIAKAALAALGEEAGNG